LLVSNPCDLSPDEFGRYLKRMTERVIFFKHYEQANQGPKPTGDFSSSVRMAYQRRKSNFRKGQKNDG
jgi:hypothetical protein